jgi:hypothetical protein
MLGFCGLPVEAIGALDTLLPELFYEPVSKIAGLAGD